MIINASAHQMPLANKSIHSIVTSPPYYGLRAYTGDQGVDWPEGVYAPCTGAPACIEVPAMRCGLGAEPTVAAYIWHMLLVLRECYRVLRDDGTCWINLGDSYSAIGGYSPNAPSNQNGSMQGKRNRGGIWSKGLDKDVNVKTTSKGIPSGNLLGVPHRLMLAAQADGWILRNDCIWAKASCMPESVTGWRYENDRLNKGSWRHTRSHEFVFMLCKQMQYYGNSEIVRESKAESTTADPRSNDNGQRRDRAYPGAPSNGGTNLGGNLGGRNPRSVLTPAPSAYSGQHFAVFPPELIRPLILSSVPRRCCPKCGAGWASVVERRPDHGLADFGFPKTDALSDQQNGHQRLHRRQRAARSAGEDHDNPLGGSFLQGYRPTCDCWRQKAREVYETDLKPHLPLEDAVATLRPLANEIAEEFRAVPGILLDPFVGSGTSGSVARECLVNFIGLDISFEYLEQQALWRAERQISTKRINALPLFAGINEETHVPKP